jgi:hypothetical protein
MSEATMTDRILVQRDDFSLADEYARLAPGRTQARLSALSARCATSIRGSR